MILVYSVVHKVEHSAVQVGVACDACLDLSVLAAVRIKVIGALRVPVTVVCIGPVGVGIFCHTVAHEHLHWLRGCRHHISAVDKEIVEIAIVERPRVFIHVSIEAYSGSFAFAHIVNNLGA